MNKFCTYLQNLFLGMLLIGQLFTLTSCSIFNKPKNNEVKAQSKQYFTYFDTVSVIYSYAGDSPEQFNENCEEVSGILDKYHKLFDIYYEHSGVVNLCTINKNAGGQPQKVDDLLITFLEYCIELYNLTNGEFNPMLGAVLKPWHDARETASFDPTKAYVPSMEVLKEASLHTSIELLEIDKENKTVRIKDPKASIDVGALGKGYATEQAAKFLESKKVNSYVLNIGGNIRIIGTKVNGDGWLTGIKNPFDTSTYSLFTRLKDTSCVTSGNYERYYMVDDVRYHHIIDKDTLLPSTEFASISIITKDSGLADALSTALFCMSYEEGLNLVNKLQNVEVFWIYNDGTQKMTSGIIPEDINK